MRLFVALNLPKEERKRIHGACAELRERDLPVRWVRAEHYHVTLKFLGKVSAERVPEIEDVLRRIGLENQPFEVELAGFGAFPTIRRPRVLWLGVQASPRLRCIKQDLEWGLAEHGFERESRAFHPHVTLGRARERSAAGAFRGIDELVKGMAYSSRVPFESVDLMRSKLSVEGPEYSVVSSNDLGARA